MNGPKCPVKDLDSIMCSGEPLKSLSSPSSISHPPTATRAPSRKSWMLWPPFPHLSSKLGRLRCEVVLTTFSYCYVHPLAHPPFKRPHSFVDLSPLLDCELLGCVLILTSLVPSMPARTSFHSHAATTTLSDPHLSTTYPDFT